MWWCHGGTRKKKSIKPSHKENLQFDKSALVNSIKHFRNNTNFTKTQKLRVWSGNKEVQIDQWNRMVRNKPAIDWLWPHNGTSDLRRDAERAPLSLPLHEAAGPAPGSGHQPDAKPASYLVLGFPDSQIIWPPQLYDQFIFCEGAKGIQWRKKILCFKTVITL